MIRRFKLIVFVLIVVMGWYLVRVGGPPPIPLPSASKSTIPIGMVLPELLEEDPVYQIYLSMGLQGFPTLIRDEERALITRSGGEALYGELTMHGCEQLFKRANLGASSIFYDMGCGSGKGVLKAHTWGVKKAVGVELSPTRYAAAMHALGLLKRQSYYDSGRDVHFENSDMFAFDISDASVVFLNMYNEAVVSKVADRIRSLCKPGTIFATMSLLREYDGFRVEPPLNIRMSWSQAEGTPVYLYNLQ